MYKKVDTSLNFVEREKEIVEYWNEKKVFEKSMKATEGNAEFSFYPFSLHRKGRRFFSQNISALRSGGT